MRRTRELKKLGRSIDVFEFYNEREKLVFTEEKVRMLRREISGFFSEQQVNIMVKTLYRKGKVSHNKLSIYKQILEIYKTL